jgi:hypothetical protein
MIRIDEVWYLSVTTVTLQAIGVVLLLLREFKTRLVFAPLPAAALVPAGSATAPDAEPILVERLVKLAHASKAEESDLTAGLSRGPFAGEWGALPVALWLAQESRGDDRPGRHAMNPAM